MECVAVIVGSAFSADREIGSPVEHPSRIRPAWLGGASLEPVDVDTTFGAVTLYEFHPESDSAPLERPAYVIFRHGLPHTWLPHQIPYRAFAEALRRLRCRSLLITTSVGILNPKVPLNTLLPVGDLLMPENRLPDGSACTMWPTPSKDHGHLVRAQVLQEGLFSRSVTEELRELCPESAIAADPVLFAYAGVRRTFFRLPRFVGQFLDEIPMPSFVQGPRTKTSAENRMWARLGADVNSMTLGPEAVLANEMEIPVAGIAVGHKLSLPRDALEEVTEADGRVQSTAGVHRSLEASQEALRTLVVKFLRRGRTDHAFKNFIYRFE